MGQQQLLLLVLATVIVGLATVAGIEAFDENQSQASQDALVQRGTEIASNIKGLQGRPAQMGGIDLTADDGSIAGDDVADRLGYEHTSGEVAAEGAGNSGTCTINAGNGDGSIDVVCNSEDAPRDVTVTFDATVSTDSQISTAFGSTG